MTDLAHKESFDDYLKHFHDVSASTKEWTEMYVKKHCEIIVEGGKTKLCKLAEENLTNIFQNIIRTVNQLPKKSKDIKTWLTAFHEALSKELSLSKNEIIGIVGSQEVNDYNSFTLVLVEELSNTMGKIQGELSKKPCPLLNMADWSKSPHITLFNTLVGCNKTCPFCREQCELLDSDHEGNHSVLMHRPECLGFYLYVRSNELVLETCTESVVSDGKFRNDDTKNEYVLMKEYKKIYPEWHIPTDSADNDPVYWKWFIYKYRHDLLKYLEASGPQIPESWEKSKEVAIVSLHTLYEIK